jgi:hypothetical protein
VLRHFPPASFCAKRSAVAESIRGGNIFALFMPDNGGLHHKPYLSWVALENVDSATTLRSAQNDEVC